MSSFRCHFYPTLAYPVHYVKLVRPSVTMPRHLAAKLRVAKYRGQPEFTF